MSSRLAFLANRMPIGLKNRTGAKAVALSERALATGPACPICALTAAPSAWIASVNRWKPGTASGRIQMPLPSVRPPCETAQYATVVMPTPPAAGSRWYSMRSSLTSAPGVRASKVADLMMRLRNVMGPSFAGASTSGASDMVSRLLVGVGGHARLDDVAAITLDGKITRDEIFVDLKERVAALTAAGKTPGLGTVLVGDDPGSQAYVRGKHADCAKVGITSLRRDLPADITQAKLNETIDELNANPECTGYIVQLPLPKQLNESAALERIDPAKDADGLHPTNLGRLVLNTPAPLPCTPRGIVHLLRRFDV